jgi:cytidylate kinase
LAAGSGKSSSSCSRDGCVIISISGRPGSGKSAVAKVLAAQLGLDHVSAGDFMRDMAHERGVSILELSRTAEGDIAIDHEIDARTRTLGATRDDFVIDARLAWHFLPDSIKVFLDVRPEVAAARVYGAQRGIERENVDLAATQRAIEARSRSETERYRRYYGIDYTDPAHFDLVVDTSDLDITGVVARVRSFIEERTHGEGSREAASRRRPEPL